MPTLVKTKSGLIYENNFDDLELGPKLMVAPIDSIYSLTELPGYLKVTTIDNIPSRIMMEMPEGEFTFYTIIDYLPPVDNSNTSGITLFKDDFNYLELQEYYSEEIDVGINYRYLQVQRDGYNMSFYGSEDNATWKFIGIGNFTNPGKIGVYNRGSLEMWVDYIALSLGTKSTIYSVPPGYTVEMWRAADDVLISTYTNSEEELSFQFDVPCRFGGYFKIYDEYMNLIETTIPENMYGGDEYVYNLKIDVSILNEDTGTWDIIPPNTPIDLGMFDGINISRRLKISSNDSTLIPNLQVSVIKKYFNNGYKIVDIVEMNGDTQVGEYTKILQLFDIEPGTEIELNMKIERNADVIYDTHNQFIVELKGW